MKPLQRLISRFDREDMLQHLRNFPQHLREAYDNAKASPLNVKAKTVENILILGMGGSAIGGEMVQALALRYGTRPFFLLRDYTLPAWVTAKTLVVAVSYSGNTEETLSAATAATLKGAPVVGISSGGKLSELIKEVGGDVFKVPPSLPPRAAFGYLFTTQLVLFQRLGLLDLPLDQWLPATHRLAKHLVQTYGPAKLGGRAYNMARDLQDKLVVIYAGAQLLAPVAARWKGQLCENAKHLAYHSLYPEMNHNEIVGWEQNPDLLKRIAIIHLQDEEDHERVLARMDKTSQMIAPLAGSLHFCHSEGQNPLARMISLVQLGDWVSYYLALLHEVDPTPVEPITKLKAYLATLKGAEEK